MVRRKRSDSDDVSLFPFLSVLASIIGVLTLLISAVALAQMDNDTVVRAEQYEKLRKKIEEREQEIKDLQGRIADGASRAGEKQKQLASAREQLEELENQIDQSRQLNDQQQAVEIPQDELVTKRQEIDQVQLELKEIQDHVAQLVKELEERKKPAIESEVTILPSGSGSGLDPVFVECAVGSVVIHSVTPPLRIRKQDLAQDKTFAQLLGKTKSSKTQTIVFLVRDDGLATYHHARNLANRREARNGKLPVVGQGEIDLSYFNKKK